MNVQEIMCRMIDYSHGNHHDINHFMKVYAFARPAAGGGIGALHLPPAPAVFPASAAGAVVHVPQGTRRALPKRGACTRPFSVLSFEKQLLNFAGRFASPHTVRFHENGRE